jgi:hypothetical protein
MAEKRDELATGAVSERKGGHRLTRIRGRISVWVWIGSHNDFDKLFG